MSSPVAEATAAVYCVGQQFHPIGPHRAGKYDEASLLQF